MTKETVSDAMVEAARNAFKRRGWGYRDEDIRAALSAALASDGSDLRDLEAAINRIRAGAQEGWKPIETAPKDGSPFLAFGSYVYEGDTAPTIYMGVAEYSDEPNWPWRDAEGLHRETFYSHWMPLPAAPSPEAKGGRS